MTKKVIITGASDGIGRATAILFANKGLDVLAVARREEKLLDLIKEFDQIKDQGAGKIHFFCADVGVEESVQALVKHCQEINFDVDIIVNCAGAGRWLYLHETPPQEARQMMAAPFWGSYLMSHFFLPQMLKKNSGHIIDLSTPASIFPWPGATMYTAVRSALTGMARALRADLYGTKVHASLLIPGEVKSSYFEINTGAYERMPSISKMFPVMEVEDVAQELWKIAKKNRSQEKIAPFILRLVQLFGRFFPKTVQFFITSSGSYLGKQK